MVFSLTSDSVVLGQAICGFRFTRDLPAPKSFSMTPGQTYETCIYHTDSPFRGIDRRCIAAVGGFGSSPAQIHD